MSVILPKFILRKYLLLAREVPVLEVMVPTVIISGNMLCVRHCIEASAYIHVSDEKIETPNDEVSFSIVLTMQPCSKNYPFTNEFNPNNLVGRNPYLHFTDKKTKAQRGSITCLMSHSEGAEELPFKSKKSCPKESAFA